jgi:trehalose 6-phosphate synthase/phosphatase
LVANLEQMLAESPVRAVKGQKTVEVKLIWANKGEVYSRLLRSEPEPEFILAAGDDVTDEDLFAQLPPTAWTIHVGPSRSRARFFVAGPEEMVELVSQLSDSLAVGNPACPNVRDLPADLHSENSVTGDMPLMASRKTPGAITQVAK